MDTDLSRMPVPAAGFDEGTLYRSLFAASPDALLLVDAGGTIVLANPAAARLLGYGVEALTGLNVDALVPDAARPRHAAYRADYARQPRPRPMGMQMELVARRRDGSEVCVEIALSPLQSQGLPYVLAAIRDVSAYPRAKQALQRARYAESVAQLGRLAVDTRDQRQLLERVPVAAAQALECEAAAVLLLEPDQRHVRVVGACGVLAVPGADAGLPVLPDAEALHVLRRGEPLAVADYVQEQRFDPPPQRATAGLRSALVVPLLDRGRATGLLSAHACRPERFGEDELRYLQSLSNLLASSLQRAQGEEALRHAQRLESVGQLTGGIAHDFNNLLTVIHGNLQVLQDLPALAGDAYGLQLVDAALRGCRRGAALTGKLLAFSRRQVLQPREVDAAQLVASLADMLRRTLDQRIEIGVELEPLAPVLADPGQLEAALLNIAINARDAMAEGGRLRFSGRAVPTLPPEAAREAGLAEASAGYVAIAVSDSGVGMSGMVRERAFEPFFTTKPPGRGTGLGLSTVYGFVTQSHGAVTLDSAPGAGTTVTLYIPRVPAEAAEASAEAAAPALALPAGLRVLLVEDDAEVREVMRGFLCSLGCEVTSCAGGEQALGLDPAQGFELLLSDVVLGAGMRGPELARQAAARWPGLAVLLMSGYSSQPVALRDAGRHAWRLLQKPCSREQLARAMAEALERR
ncbi:PAS domain S-box protein [uncultured Azohydromonas sp.]|mgnify:CR=1 FL=1|jgi:PAS domain S-box|uniref:PAS domain S-box protein n=1 Tax=uncultured Azohydromonas sp. TaxID=487342 RepID=UPI00262B6B58|nr:PAS domain S-box protein [uncultured Azohydromonas sp.]